MNDMKKPSIRFKGFTEDWEQRKLNEICNYTSSSLTVNNVSEKGRYPLYDANTQIGMIDLFHMSEDYITVIKDGAGVGRIRKLPKNTAFIGTMGALTSNNNELDFLYYLLEKKDLSKQFTGSTIPHIYFKDYGEDLVLVPNFDEQHQLGIYFSHLDNLITLHQRKYDKLVNAKKSMLEKMFPREGKNIPEIRFSGFTETWEQRKLGEIVERVVRKNINNESTLPLTISAQYGLVDQITYFNNRVASRDVSNYYLVLNGEFAYNKSTSDGFPFGVVKRLDLYKKGVLSTLYIVFSIKNQVKTNSDFLTVFFDTDRWHKGVSERATEGARNHGLLNISAEDFFDIELCLPKLEEEQATIGAYFKRLDNLITLHQREVEKLKNIKKSFLEKMFV